jgi:hypothetical protein
MPSTALETVDVALNFYGRRGDKEISTFCLLQKLLDLCYHIMVKKESLHIFK